MSGVRSPELDRPGRNRRVDLHVRDLTIGYRGEVVLRDLTLAVSAGTSCALVGPSGSGKSSVLDAIAGITRPLAGTIHVGSREVTTLTDRQAAGFRGRHIGLVSQAAELLDELNVLENVALPLRLSGTAAAQADERARQSLASVELDQLADRRVDEVSGGEAQRVAIARALCRDDVQLILADEPTAALDQEKSRQIARLLVRTATEVGAAVLLATHDPVVMEACDTIVDLRAGPQ